MWDDKAKVYTLLEDEHLRELYDFLLINNLDFEQFLSDNHLKGKLREIKSDFIGNKVFDVIELKNKLKQFSQVCIKKLKRHLPKAYF